MLPARDSDPLDDGDDEWPVAPCISCGVALPHDREALGEAQCARCARRQPFDKATILDVNFPSLR